jgi:hypothetical protein
MSLAGPPPAEPNTPESFFALDLNTAPTKPAEPATPVDETDLDDEDDDPPRGPSLLTLVLFSYASAVTLGLIWVLFTGRTLREREPGDNATAADASPDPGRRAKASRRIVVPTPIAAEHMTTLARPVVLGSLEVTPLAVTSGPVRLKHLVGGHETTDGGADALKLKLRLKNISTDLVFAPLDEAFLREHAQGGADSLIETSTGGQIDMYPLSVSSELAIEGQPFKETHPGESFESIVVSAADSTPKRTPDMTWRVRLRTGINLTDTIGVRFRESDIKPEP